MGAALGIAIIGAVMFGTFASASIPLVEQSTAFEDFGARVAANTRDFPGVADTGHADRHFWRYC